LAGVAEKPRESEDLTADHADYADQERNPKHPARIADPDYRSARIQRIKKADTTYKKLVCIRVWSWLTLRESSLIRVIRAIRG
jgi:hypothetical protein